MDVRNAGPAIAVALGFITSSLAVVAPAPVATACHDPVDIGLFGNACGSALAVSAFGHADGSGTCHSGCIAVSGSGPAQNSAGDNSCGSG